MPNIKSAAKRVKTSEIRNLRNRQMKSVIKTKIKRFENDLLEKDLAAAETSYREAVGILDRAARKGTIHKNMASRKKSQLSIALRKAQQG